MTPAQLAARKQAAASQQSQIHSDSDVEELGARTVAGVEAQGTRITRTIAAGAEGNELAMVTTQEVWHSKELGLDLMRLDDDPRGGRTTMEFEELSRAEPDPSIFAPPDGYTIEDDQATTGDTPKP